jgi:hypothetical protein
VRMSRPLPKEAFDLLTNEIKYHEDVKKNVIARLKEALDILYEERENRAGLPSYYDYPLSDVIEKIERAIKEFDED